MKNQIIMADPKSRLREMENLWMEGVKSNEGKVFSVETLMDILIVLFDECSNSTLRREKNVSEFVEYGEAFTCFL